MANVELLGMDLSNWVRAARIACIEKGVDYELVPVGPNIPEDLRTKEYLAIHPFGRMPAMRHGDVIVFETAAIGRYIDAFFEGPAIIPEDPLEAVRMEQWVSTLIDYIARPVMARFVIQHVFPRGENGEPDRATIDAAIPDIRTNLAVFDKVLARGPYLHGATPYLDDFILAPMLSAMTITPEGPGLIDEAPNVRRFIDTFSERESFQATIPEMFRKAA